MGSVHVGRPRAWFARLSAFAGIAMALVAASPAAAELSPITFTIEASNSTGSGTYSAELGVVAYDRGTGTYLWSLPRQISILHPITQEVIATLSRAHVTYVDDPQVLVSFAVTAGAFDTNFTITTALNSFPGIDNAQGRASAALTITDNDGNGAELNGLGPEGGSYIAQYNGLFPAGTTFAELLNSVSAGPGGSGSASEEYPGGGAYSAIAGTVTSMSAGFTFTLSAHDVATGSSNFTIIPIPEPGAVALVTLGIAVARRRRRRE